MSWLTDRWMSGIGEAALDPEQLGKAQALARNDRVRLVGIEPGRIEGVVFDRVERCLTIGMAQVPTEANETVAEALGSSPELLADVIIADMPAEIDGLLLDAGIDIVPSPNEILVDCDCEAYEPVCRHGLAVLIELGVASQSDAFAFALVRGLDRSQILERAYELRGQTVGRGESILPRGPDQGTSAAAAFKREPQPVPAALLFPARPGTVAPLEPPPPLDSGLSSADLADLINDSASRAVDLLSGNGSSTLRSKVSSDLARRARNMVSSGSSLDQLAKSAGTSATELAEAARCWNIGGDKALAVRADSWAPDPDLMELGSASFDPPGRVSANLVSSGNLQLRLDRDQRWWRFEANPSRGWVLASGGFELPQQALDDDLTELGVEAIIG